MSAAFRAWAEHVAESAARRAKVRSSLGRIMHRSQGLAFEAWRAEAEDARERRRGARERMLRVLKRVGCCYCVKNVFPPRKWCNSKRCWKLVCTHIESTVACRK